MIPSTVRLLSAPWPSRFSAAFPIDDVAAAQDAPVQQESSKRGDLHGMGWKKKTVFALLPAILLLLLVEGTLRLVGYRFEGRKELRLVMASEREFWDANIVQDPDVLYRFEEQELVGPVDENGYYRLIDADINAQGYRGDVVEFAPAPSTTLRIATIGDSVTYGVRMEREFSYPEKLEDALESRIGQGRWANKTSVDVVNLGLPSYTSAQCLWDFEVRGRKLRPDIVIVMFATWNDFSPTSNHMTDEEVKRHMARATWLREGFGQFRIIQAGTEIYEQIWKRVAKWRKRETDAEGKRTGNDSRRENLAATRRVPLTDFRDHLDRFLQMAREDGFELVVVVPGIPSFSRKERGHVFEPYHDMLMNYELEHSREINEGLLRVVDLQPLAEANGGDNLFLDDCHLTREGCELVANHFASVLSE